MPPPEAVLTELVIMTLLAAVAEAHHTLSMAVGALDRVKDCREERRSHTQTDVTLNPDMLHAAVRKGFGFVHLRTEVLQYFVFLVGKAPCLNTTLQQGRCVCSVFFSH